MNQLALLVIEPQYKRTEVSAAAFRFGVSADHAFDSPRDLDFLPFAAAALFVETSSLLGQNSFEAFLPRHFKERFTLFFVVIGIAQGITRDQNRPQLMLALSEGHSPPLLSLDIYQTKR